MDGNGKVAGTLPQGSFFQQKADFRLAGAAIAACTEGRAHRFHGAEALLPNGSEKGVASDLKTGADGGAGIQGTVRTHRATERQASPFRFAELLEGKQLPQPGPGGQVGSWRDVHTGRQPALAQGAAAVFTGAAVAEFPPGELLILLASSAAEQSPTPAAR